MSNLKEQVETIEKLGEIKAFDFLNASEDKKQALIELEELAMKKSNSIDVTRKDECRKLERENTELKQIIAKRDSEIVSLKNMTKTIEQEEIVGVDGRKLSLNIKSSRELQAEIDLLKNRIKKEEERHYRDIKKERAKQLEKNSKIINTLSGVISELTR